MTLKALLPYIQKSVILLILLSCSKKETGSLTSNMVTADSVVSITETGQIEAVNFSSLTTPGRWRLEYRIRYLPPEGSFVSKGDTVVIFDTQETQSMLDEAQASLDLFTQKLKETREKNYLAMQQKKKALQSVSLDLQSALLVLQNSVYESETARKEAELQVKKAKLNLQRAKKELEAQRIINRKKEDVVLLDVQQAKGKIKQAKKTFNDMFLVAPRSGMVIYEKLGWMGGGEKIKTGDVLRPQTSVLYIPDLNKIKAVIRLNEVDRSYLKTGLKAQVRVEAFPDTLFEGEVTFISRIVNRDRELEQVKTYDVDVQINSRQNFRLKPGLSAHVVIFTDTLHQVFRLPSYCLLGEKGRYRVSSENGSVPVELVRLNDGYAFVRGGLKAGQKLNSRE